MQQTTTEHVAKTDAQQVPEDLRLTVADAATDKAVRLLEAKHGFELDMMQLAYWVLQASTVKAAFQFAEFVHQSKSHSLEAKHHADMQALVTEIGNELVESDARNMWYLHKGFWSDIKTKRGLK